MALTDLPALLRDEPAMLQVLGRNAALLAVPEPARPLALAGLATVGSRRPILVAVPTTAEAEELRRLRKENAELRRANEILKAASAFFAQEMDPTRKKW